MNIGLSSSSRRSFCQRYIVAVFCLAMIAVMSQPATVSAQTDSKQSLEPSQRFNAFVKQQAALLRAQDAAPKTAEEWMRTREQLRTQLLEAWGGFPTTPCPLDVRSFGELKRDGYRVEKLAIQTMTDIWMTANLYVPESDDKKRHPAVLCVHGHWSGAHVDPVVQSRCIGLAKLGFVVLCVDAFGAGERAIETPLGEYHGEMTGAMLLPIGKPLSGVQVYENMRAVDYLQSRPDVDPERIGVTGASGGGNQSMYAGAYDERLRCVVPTCSVGNYTAYLSAACCMCEVVPGILQVTEEGNVLGLAAGRGLMVTSATQDAFQFSVDQAKISVARATEIASLLDPSKRMTVKHTIIESPHHYNQPMREAMYGWMTLHLKGEGDGSPIAEPSIVPEEPEVLRCFPADSRPKDYVTLPQFAAAEARQLLDQRRDNQDRITLKALAEKSSATERSRVRVEQVQTLIKRLGGLPASTELNVEHEVASDGNGVELTFTTEAGLEIAAKCDAFPAPAERNNLKVAILLDVEKGSAAAFAGQRAKRLRSSGWTVVAPELRATGRFAVPSDKIGNAPDHNSAEWSLWIGRPLLGQWVVDIQRTLDAVKSHTGSAPKEVMIVGNGSSGIIALTAAAIDERVTHAVTFDSLASYVTDKPYRGQRLGILVPGLLRDVGDVGHLAALVAPRSLTIYGGVNGAGESLSKAAIQTAYQHTTDVYSALNVQPKLNIVTAKP